MKSSSECGGTMKFTRYLGCILYFLATVAALMGVYQTHFGIGTMNFGSTSASLALIAFAISLHLWIKCMHRCCCDCKK